MTQPVWVPSRERVADANLTRFMRDVGEKNGIPVADYASVYQFSIDRPSDFWRAVWDFTGIIGERGNRVLENPERILRLLCEAIGLDFTEAMLSWPPGLRETDGVWAKHWYKEVETSTGFRKSARGGDGTVPAQLRSVCERARESYERLYEHRLG